MQSSRSAVSASDVPVSPTQLQTQIAELQARLAEAEAQKAAARPKRAEQTVLAQKSPSPSPFSTIQRLAID